MEFETTKELLDFVLIKCSNMDYYDNIDHKSHLSKGLDIDYELMIRENFDMEKVYYAIKLLKEKFNITIEKLAIYDDEFDEFTDFLKFTQIKRLDMYKCKNCRYVPELPSTVIDIRLDDCAIEKIEKINGVESPFSNDNISIWIRDCFNLKELPELPDSVNHIDVGYTGIESLPNIPKKLSHLFCTNSPLFDRTKLNYLNKVQIESLKDIIVK